VNANPLWIVGFLVASLGGERPPQSAASYRVASPSGDLAVEIVVGDELTFSMTWRDRLLVAPSPISLVLSDSARVGPSAEVSDVQRRRVDETIVPVVPEKYSQIRDR
jgi:hypothetical protein